MCYYPMCKDTLDLILWRMLNDKHRQSLRALQNRQEAFMATIRQFVQEEDGEEEEEEAAQDES